MTEIAAGRSSGRLLRRRYSEHNRRRMEKHRSLPTLAPMSQQHAWELLQKLAGRAGLLEGSGGHATIPPYMLRHSCTTLAFDKGVWRA
jgi:site-specific recombinase XerD